MWKSLRFAPLLLLLPATLFAQSESFGLGAGPFIFGHFVERTNRIGNETDSSIVRSTLSAATRVGVTADFEHDLNSWLAVRLQGTFTHAPLKVKTRSGNTGVQLNAGTMNVTTVALPFVVRLNRRGSFRFHLMAGPAWAMYDAKPAAGVHSSGVFEGTRDRWGVEAGGGVSWWLSDRVAVSGEIADIYTSSPFERSDLPALTTGVDIPRTHNIHTTAGIRYRF